MNTAQAIISLKSAVRSAGFMSMALHGAGLGIRLLFMLAILQLSGAKLLGEYGLLVSIELVTVYLAGFEFHSFTTRRYARRPIPSNLRLALASHGRMLIISAPLAVTAAASATWAFALNLSKMELLMFLFIVFSGSVVQEANRFIVMTKNPVYAIATAFVRTAAWQPVTFLFLDDANALQWILTWWCVAALFSTIWALWLLRSAISLRTKVHGRYLVKGMVASKGYYVIATSTVMQGNAERFVLQSFLGPEAVGLFALFQTLANTLSALVQSAVLNVALPLLLIGFGQKQPDRFAILERFRWRAFWVGAVTAVAIMASSAAVLVLTARTEYISSAWMLLPLLIGQIILMSTLPMQLAIYGGHHDKALMQMSILVLLITLAMSVIMVSQFGINGAIASQLIGCLIVSMARRGLFSHLKENGKL